MSPGDIRREQVEPLARKPMSFMNEHSAEFILVPDLVSVLAPAFERVIPTYLWLNREGGRLARECLGNRSVRVVTAYARRPKVLHAGDCTVTIRVNPELYEAAAKGAERGSPVLAGVPVVNSLEDLALGVSCRWLLLDPKPKRGLQEDVRLDAATGKAELLTGLSEMSATDLVRTALAARPMAWHEAVETMRSFRELDEAGSRWWWRPVYRPFHLILLGS
jgi:hypothetical protein